jgi:hypothetical protein
MYISCSRARYNVATWSWADGVGRDQKEIQELDQDKPQTRKAGLN